MNTKTAVILLAEDDPDDQYLIGEALDESLANCELYIVENGEELLAYLERRGKYADHASWPTPDLILLDLNMPRIDGREALQKIKADGRLRNTPVVVITTSQAQEDVQQAYAWGASGFISKPASFKELVATMQALKNYWFDSVDLPPRRED